MPQTLHLFDILISFGFFWSSNIGRLFKRKNEHITSLPSSQKNGHCCNVWLVIKAKMFVNMDAYDDDHNCESSKDITNGFNGPSYITSNKDEINDVSNGGE